jgi:hypothetical protein
VVPVSVSNREARLEFISQEFTKWNESPPNVLGMMAAASIAGTIQGVVNKHVHIFGNYGTLILSSIHFFPKIGTMFGSEMTGMDVLSGMQDPMMSFFIAAGGYNGKLNVLIQAYSGIFKDKKAAQRFIELIVEEFKILDTDCCVVSNTEKE